MFARPGRSPGWARWPYVEKRTWPRSRSEQAGANREETEGNTVAGAALRPCAWDACPVHCRKQAKAGHCPGVGVWHGDESGRGRLSRPVTRGPHVGGTPEPAVQSWRQPAGRRGLSRPPCHWLVPQGGVQWAPGYVAMGRNPGGTWARSGLRKPGPGSGRPEAEDGVARGPGSGGRAAHAWARPPVPAASAGHTDGHGPGGLGHRPVAPDSRNPQL